MMPYVDEASTRKEMCPGSALALVARIREPDRHATSYGRGTLLLRS